MFVVHKVSVCVVVVDELCVALCMFVSCGRGYSACRRVE